VMFFSELGLGIMHFYQHYQLLNESSAVRYKELSKKKFPVYKL